jgi:hypothetical protein
MAAITETYRALLSLGNRDAVIVKTNSIDDSDYLDTGLSVVEHVSLTNAVSGQTGGYTVSGTRVTFALSGSFGATSILVVGFK